MPVARRNHAESQHVIHLLRHGQYTRANDPAAEHLTALGRRQARIAAAYLRGLPISGLWSSDLIRAVETAELVAERLELPFRQSPLLRELIPTAVPELSVPYAKRRHARATLERIVERFFRPVRVTRHDLLVCHGNLIRALVCRVLRCPPTSWLRMATHNCGLSSITVRADGAPQLLHYSQCAYLPIPLQTRE